MVIKIKTLFLGLVLLAGMFTILAPQSVSAGTGDPEASTGGGGSEESGACGVETTILQCNGGDSNENPIIRTFMEIFDFFAVGIGILVVIGIIIGGIKYVTANGNTSQAEQGITTIVNAVIGLLLFIFMFALVNWLVPGGLFT